MDIGLACTTIGWRQFGFEKNGLCVPLQFTRHRTFSFELHRNHTVHTTTAYTLSNMNMVTYLLQSLSIGKSLSRLKSQDRV